MRAWIGGIAVLGLAAATACQETLATPTTCPQLCPGLSLAIRDTVLLPVTGLDSTFTGYLSAGEVPALLVSSGLAAGEARAWAVFPHRPDSISVVGVQYTYAIDSAAFVFHLLARDSAVKNLRLIVHQIHLPIDTTTSFADLAPLLTPATVIDSVLVSDTLKTGNIRVVLQGDALNRLNPFGADSGKFGIAVRVSAPAPTGVRLSARLSSQGGPVFLTYVHAAVTDTALQRQILTIPDSVANYVIAVPPPPGPDQLVLGGKAGSRAILRFRLPKAIKDSASLIRATLELTLPEPLRGLPNDPAQLQIRPVLVDVGAKSPTFSGASGAATLEAGASGVQRIEVRGVVETWFGAAGLTPSLLLGLAPEGGTFTRMNFFSTRAQSGVPRLRITYALASRPGFP